MNRITAIPFCCVAAAILGSLIPAGVEAQALPGPVRIEGPRDWLVPDVTISVAIGTHFPTGFSSLSGPGTAEEPYTWFYHSVPTIEASVQIPIRESVIVEGQLVRGSAQSRHSTLGRIVNGVTYGTLARSDCVPPLCTALLEKTTQESREALTISANLLFRAGTPRLATFFGGGLGIQRTDGRLDILRTCEAQVPGGCRTSPSEEGHHQDGLTVRPALQVIYGVDVTVAPRLAAFAAFRWAKLGRVPYDTNELAGVGITGGMRFAAGTRAIPLAAKEVRVTEASGLRRKGRLLALSDTEVLLRRDADNVRIPLAAIDKIETISHHALTGALIGTAYAAAMWISIAMTRDTCADCEDGPLVAKFMTPVAIGAGAGIGAIVNAATRNRHLLYLAPGRSRSPSVTPNVSAKRAGVSMAIRW